MEVRYGQTFKAGKIQEARKLLCGTIPEEMEEVYHWLYDNIELSRNEEQQDPSSANY